MAYQSPGNMWKFVWGTWLLLSIVPVVAHAAGNAGNTDTHWQVGSAPSFSSGKYGTDGRTEVLHTPFTARRLFDKGDVTLVFPFTCITGNGVVTVVNGSPVRSQRSASGTTGTTTGRTGRTADTSTPSSAAAPTTNCGMGDIVVRARYYLVDERAWMPTIALRAHVKTPTASAERGLGTGQPDEGVGLEVSRRLAPNLLAMVDGGYTVIGKPVNADYTNNWWYDVGIGRDLANGVVNLSVFFEEDRAIVQGLDNARSILTAVTLKGASGWRFQVSGEFGLSDGAPAQGVTIGASRRF